MSYREQEIHQKTMLSTNFFCLNRLFILSMQEMEVCTGIRAFMSPSSYKPPCLPASVQTHTYRTPVVIIPSSPPPFRSR